MKKLYIAMVGLPARGKSTVALRLCEGLLSNGINARIFNNGDIRREWVGASSTQPDFYHPDNEYGREIREKIAQHNIQEARFFFKKGGEVAILDATNASRSRRKLLEANLTDAPLLFIECVNTDERLMATSISNKAMLAEFTHLTHEQAIHSFEERIAYYQQLFSPLSTEKCYLRLDTLNNSIIKERFSLDIPHYIVIRDILVSDWVQDLYLARHGESFFNTENKIGGNSSLTAKGKEQAQRLAKSFENQQIPYIFTSEKKRSLETAASLLQQHPKARWISLGELDEIDAGICDGLSYAAIKETMPEEYIKRGIDKYNYIYPEGEGYVSMRKRVEVGFRKALFLAAGQPNIVIIGHQAVNRMILSLFLFRRTEDVPYIFVPQDQFFHITATHKKKLFELVPFS